MAVSGADVEKIKEGIGYGIPPKNAENLIATGFGGKAQLSWTIGDTEINGQVICTIKGCMIRKKQGSAPQSLEDGTLVATLNREQAMSYSEVPYEDPQSIGTSSDWYYRLFCYSDHDVFNLDDRNIVKVRGTARAKIWGFRQDFSNLNPDSQITYIEDASGFTPANHYNLSNLSNGSWDNWEWMQGNLPYVVEFSTGKKKWDVKPVDFNYSVDGKKIDTEVNGRTNGYFAWLPKIYWKEIYINQNVREVRFATTNRDPRTKDFELPDIFRNKNGEELEGFWLPCYSVSAPSSNWDYNQNQVLISKPGGYASISSGVGENMRPFLNSVLEVIGENGTIIGGQFFLLMRDIFYLLYRTPNMRKGYGGVQGTLPRSNSVDAQSLLMTANLNGRFFGSNDINNRYRYKHRVFYSAVFNGADYGIVDPYFLINTPNRLIRFGRMPNHNEDSFMEKRFEFTVTHAQIRYMDGMKKIDGFGSVPSSANGSSSTGLCAELLSYSTGNAFYKPIYLTVFNGSIGNNNLATMYLSGINLRRATILATVIPPVGYSPK